MENLDRILMLIWLFSVAGGAFVLALLEILYFFRKKIISPPPSKRTPAICYHPGEFVKDEMESREWDVLKLAEEMGHAQPDVVMDLIECKRDVNFDIALRLQTAFGVSASFWMKTQLAYDLWKSNQ